MESLTKKIRLKKDGSFWGKYPSNRKTHICSIETREKIRNAHLGRKVSENGKKNISLGHIGQIPWNKGMKGFQTAWNKGKKFSDESRKKMSLSHIITGSTSENKRLRRSSDFIEWRKSVFERDNYTCKKCFKIGGKLHPHHIFSFAKFKILRFDLDNGITFCEDCHREFHRKYGQRSFRSESLILFLPLWEIETMNL